MVRDQGSTAAALRWSISSIFDVDEDDTMLTASDLGWVVGHSYIVYAPLLAGATTVLYEGKPVGTPDAGALWRLVDQHRVTSLFTAPHRAARRAQGRPRARAAAALRHLSLRWLFVAGERLDPKTQRWIGEGLDVPVVERLVADRDRLAHRGQPGGHRAAAGTEGSATLPMAGFDVDVLDPMGEPLPAGQQGNIVIRLPLPPGTLSTLWGDDQPYIDTYLSAFRGLHHGDSGYIDGDGYISSWAAATTSSTSPATGSPPER